MHSLVTHATGVTWVTYATQVMHGLVERIMMMLDIKSADYAVRAGSDVTYMEGRCAEIFMLKDKKCVAASHHAPPRHTRLYQVAPGY